jgi:hypothetical protein
MSEKMLKPNTAEFLAKYAQTLMDRRAAGKVVFEGNLLREDGTADLPLLTAAREEWRKQRTLRSPDGRVVELPSELSAEDCQQQYVRDFYSAYPMATSVIIQPGERPKDALNRQTTEVKDRQTLHLSRKLQHVIEMQDWDFAKTIMEEILDIDPLYRRTPSPPPESWDCPPTSQEEEQAAPVRHVADPNFDWGNV